jgi:CheY-like chemotaxis protein
MSRPTAFIVEDDPQLSKIFSITLQSEFEVETATDGNEAMARLMQIAPTLILLDLHLPGVSGREILASIRADARLEKTFVILATADERMAEEMQDQADIVLLKPISPAQLRQIASRFTP